MGLKSRWVTWINAGCIVSKCVLLSGVNALPSTITTTQFWPVLQLYLVAMYFYFTIEFWYPYPKVPLILIHFAFLSHVIVTWDKSCVICTVVESERSQRAAAAQWRMFSALAFIGTLTRSSPPAQKIRQVCAAEEHRNLQSRLLLRPVMMWWE